METDHMKELLIGAGGLAHIQLLETLPLDGSTITVIIKALIQIGVGIVTIYSLLKKKKDKS